jgi:hypothetical protein
MYKLYFSSLLIFATFLSSAQTIDSVSTGTQNANDVYYSFQNGIVKTQSNTDWDLAFEISGLTAGILANHVKGVLVWQSTFSIADWNKVDTTNKINWKKMYNSPDKWSLGAFNLHTDNNFDLGWGTYEPTSHIVNGDSIYIIKLANGTYKKIAILNLNAGVYNIKYSNIDGSNEQTKGIDKANYKTKNFMYYRFDTETTFDREPIATDWDIVFTKYTVFIPTPFNVRGVWTNKTYKTAEARGVNTDITDYSPYTFTTTNSEIGYDWKTFNINTNQYELTKDLVYFVNDNKKVWKIVFTGYKGEPFGRYIFTKQGLTLSTHLPYIHSSSIYPNPAKNQIRVQLANGNIIKNVSIFNALGQLVQNGSEDMMDVSNLNHGVYLLNLITEQGIQNIKFVKD